MEAHEAAAIERAKAGDRDAFRDLVERYSRGVFRLGYRMTGNSTDAEDVVQETLFRAWKQIRSFDGRAAFSSWLHRIAANYAVDLVRARRRFDKSEGAEVRVALTTAGGPAQDQLVYAGQLSDRIEHAMGQLTPQERAAFVLRHFEGQPIEEICAALGLRTNAAKQSIFRAVQKLRRALKPIVEAAR
jgi:RNA polymerase sigma-70 factor (ECF subfamily)